MNKTQQAAGGSIPRSFCSRDVRQPPWEVKLKASSHCWVTPDGACERGPGVDLAAFAVALSGPVLTPHPVATATAGTMDSVELRSIIISRSVLGVGTGGLRRVILGGQRATRSAVLGDARSVQSPSLSSGKSGLT